VVTVDEAAYERLTAALPRLERVLKGARVDVDRRTEMDDPPERRYRRVVALREGADESDPSEAG
jgi:hypothetical protein